MNKSYIYPVAASIICGAVGFGLSHSKTAGEHVSAINNSKKYVLQQNPDKYKQLIANSKNCCVDWCGAAKEIQDSIKLDSLVRKAYFDGAEMVRDSIRNAAKTLR